MVCTKQHLLPMMIQLRPKACEGEMLICLARRKLPGHNILMKISTIFGSCGWLVFSGVGFLLAGCASHDLTEISQITIEQDLVESFALDHGRFEQYKNNDAVAPPLPAPTSSAVAAQDNAADRTTASRNSAAKQHKGGEQLLIMTDKKSGDEKLAASEKKAKAAAAKTTRKQDEVAEIRQKAKPTPLATPTPTAALPPVLSKKMNFYRIKTGKPPKYPMDYPEDFKKFDQKYHALWQLYHPVGSVGCFHKKLIHFSHMRQI